MAGGSFAFQIAPTHEPAAKAGASSAHSKRCRAMLKVPELREAFGVRPAYWRFRFMVPMRDSEIVEATHEPPRKQAKNGWQKIILTFFATDFLPTLSVREFKARNGSRPLRPLR